MQYFLLNTKGFRYILGLSFLVLGFYPATTFAGIPDDYGIIGEAILIESDTTWTKDQVREITEPTYVVNGATLTIEAGTEVKFKDSDRNSENGAGALGAVDGAIVAIGNEREWITFTGETLSFNITFGRYDLNRDISFLRYVKIGDGLDDTSNDDDGGGVLGWIKDFYVNTTNAVGSGHAFVGYYGGKAIIENVVFANKHNTALYINGEVQEDFPEDFLRLSNSNFEDIDGVPTITSATDCQSIVCPTKVKLQNNYYGKEAGPDDETFDGPAFGATFRTKELIADPVIIVPGILGSALNSQNVWEIDPILHLYDDQIKSLETNGYTMGTNLFVMPYDWHKDNVLTANALENKIDEVRGLSGVSRVDIVAHSMGGLVARQYIEGDDYGDDVDQLITLGTPHRGAPESYINWEGGTCVFDTKCTLLYLHLYNEAIHAGYTNLHQYIQEKTVSIEQLLPDYSYLSNISNSILRDYPDDTPRNTFLENLNSSSSIEKLNDLRYWNIIGSIGQENTITGLRVGQVGSDENDKWYHGEPENFGNLLTDQGLIKGSGDGTVPTVSAEYPSQVVEEKTLDSSHTALPQKSQCEVLVVLTTQTDCQYIDNGLIENILNINVFSPIDVQIVSPSGKKVGKDFETGEILSEIPGAFYSGYETDVEFVTIPNPEDGEYRILTQGVDEGGGYRVEATSIQEDPTTGKVTESQATFSGTATPNVVTEEPLKILDEAIVPPEDEEETPVDTIVPVITLTAPTAQEYLSNVIITPAYTVTDETSASEAITKTVKLDGTLLATSTIDLSLLPLGTHTFTVIATDEAGNIATQEVVFTSQVSWNSLRQNLTHYQALGLIRYTNDTLILKSRITGLELLIRTRASINLLPRVLRARASLLLEREILKQQTELTQFLDQAVQTGRIDPLVKDRVREGIDFLV